jgi:hypothetical protein
MSHHETNGVAHIRVATSPERSLADFRDEDFELAPERPANDVPVADPIEALARVVTRAKRDLGALNHIWAKYELPGTPGDVVRNKITRSTLDSVRMVLQFYS